MYGSVGLYLWSPLGNRPRTCAGPRQPHGATANASDSTPRTAGRQRQHPPWNWRSTLRQRSAPASQGWRRLKGPPVRKLEHLFPLATGSRCAAKPARVMVLCMADRPFRTLFRGDYLFHPWRGRTCRHQEPHLRDRWLPRQAGPATWPVSRTRNQTKHSPTHRHLKSTVWPRRPGDPLDPPRVTPVQTIAFRRLEGYPVLGQGWGAPAASNCLGEGRHPVPGQEAESAGPASVKPAIWRAGDRGCPGRQT